jgi:hypothetical protein
MESFLVTKSNNPPTTVTVTKEPPTSDKAHHTARLPLACYLTVHPRNISNFCHLSDGEPESVIDIFNGHANVAIQNPGI